MKVNLRLAESKLKSLSCRASDLKQEVTKAEATGKRKRKREIENWFEEVEQMENKFNELKCRIRDQPLWKNLSSGDSVAKIDANVERLMEQSKDFEVQLWLDDHENRGEPLLVTENLFGQKFQEGWKTIWDWLVKDDMFNIGIYGMGGVGKTTLAKCIHNHLLERTNFKVFWVTVSQNFSVEKMQDDIAKQVPLDISGEDDENRRAAMLSTAIANQSLLILDDVWEDFSLEDVGIPIGPKCRLILTTRSLELCDTMDCQGKFEVKCLESDEAWSLFKKTLDHGITFVEVEKIAKLVAKECAGLPLGIITVARSMRGATDIPEWRNALDQLTTLSIGYKKMEDRVFRILEWSFNHLNRYERLCFLYCCLYPEDWEIEREELINLFSLAELVPRRETRESEFDHGHTILNKLIKACLLEESKTHNGKECVKMHDLIRDMALRITCGKSISKITGDVPKFFMKNRSRKVILEESEWTQDLNAVSFIRVGLLEIPPGLSPICPKLSTLFLHHSKLKRIPDLFFKHIDGLKFLNLTCCDGLKELPSCISDMVNLNALLLANCRELESIPSLGKLKLLRKLDLSNTRITDVPQGLEELVRLECLYMLKTRLRNKIVPKGTFSKLKHLQHLELPAHISDLEVLKQLQLFRGPLTLADVHRLISSSYQPKYYDIVVMEIPCFDFEICFSDINDVRNLMFKGFNFQKGLGMVLPPEGIQMLILDNCFRLSNDFFQHLINRSKQLSYLRMRHLDEIQFLLNLSSPLLSIPQDAALATSDFVTPLQCVEDLQLYYLPDLVGLINWRWSSSSSENPHFGTHQLHLIPPGIFSYLKSLEIHACPLMKSLFSVQLLQQSLQKLEYLDVSSCEQLEEIASNDDESGEETTFQPTSSGFTTSISHVWLPKLQDLHLGRLPRLMNICKATMICDSISKISVMQCPKVKILPFFLPINCTNGQPSPPNSLEVIRGSEKWWGSLEWGNPSTKDVLQPFFKCE